MIQDQLVEYIKAQLKLGVARDAVKAALVGAGWVAADVEDTLKKVESENKPAAAASMPGPAIIGQGNVPVSAASGSAMTGAGITSGGLGGPAGAAAQKATEPRSIKMSDLVSTSALNSPIGADKAVAAKTDFFNSFSKNKSVAGASPMPMEKPMAAVPSKKGMVGKIILIVVAVGCAGAAGYFYYVNMGLSSQVSSLGGQSANVTSQLSSLTTQVQMLVASNTALTAKVSSLTGENDDLAANLSLVAAPVGASSTAPVAISLAGTLKQKGAAYTIITNYGLVASIKNASDPLVLAALKPLLTGTAPATFSGTHMPGSPTITVTAVNGASVMAAAGASSSTATSTTTP